MTRLAQLGSLLRYMGPGWLGYRAMYWGQLRSGHLRLKTPALSWSARGLSHYLDEPELGVPETYFELRKESKVRFFFAPSDRKEFASFFPQWDRAGQSPVKAAEDIGGGIVDVFGSQANAGFPPDWHKNAVTGERVPADKHWSAIDDFGYGDIKVVWELNRFGFAYTLVRAYWRTGNEKYAEWFWRLVEDWKLHNPPNLGPNWKCGQEISFRVMAWCFGLYGLLHTRASTPTRVAMLAQMIATSAERIEANIHYALSQRNNHGISEGTGLWTVGTLFPELRLAERWEALGRRVLEDQARELIYEDGSFSQHSLIYHRLLLHDYLWVIRLADLNGKPFSTEMRKKIASASVFAMRCQDEHSGQVPLYGASDGSLVLPLSNCDFLDFRPALQATSYLLREVRCFEDGPWDEDLLWLFGPKALESRLEAAERTELDGGYQTIRTSSSLAFIRCGEYRYRPGHADAMHLDLWWQGLNIAVDSGTYSYNAPFPWDDPLARTAAHNTVTVDDRDQMDRVSRFLWLPWLRGSTECRMKSVSGSLAFWQGVHDGYRRLKDPVYHRRAVVRLGDSHWVVLDRLEGNATHTYRLHWLIADLPYEWDRKGKLLLTTSMGAYRIEYVSLAGDGTSSLVRADENGPRGWRAPLYYHRAPALSMDISVSSPGVNFCTVFGPGEFSVEHKSGILKVSSSSLDGVVHLGARARDLVRLVNLVRPCVDEIRIV